MQNKILKLLFLLALFFIAPSFADAKNVYVCGDGATCNANTLEVGWLTGNNSNNGLSKLTPKLTITAGIAAMIGGDVLIIGNGSYVNEPVLAVPSGFANGTADTYTIIKGENTGGVVIDMSSVTASWIDMGISISNKSYIQIENLIVRGNPTRDGDSSNGPVIVSGSSHHVKLIRVGASGGVRTGNGQVFGIGDSSGLTRDILLEECWAWGTARYKFSVYRSNNVILRRCVIRHDYHGGNNGWSRQEALIANYDSNNTQIQNCIMIDSGDPSTYPAESMYGAIWDEKHTVEGGSSILTTATSDGDDTVYVGDTTYFNLPGSGVIGEGHAYIIGAPGTLTFTGKTSNSLTGCSGVTARPSGTEIYPSHDMDKSAKYTGNIVINIQNTAAGHFDRAAGTRVLKDNVFWDIQHGGYSNFADTVTEFQPAVSFVNNTFGKFRSNYTSACWNNNCGIGVEVGTNGIFTMTNSIVSDSLLYGIKGILSPTYSAIFNTTNYAGASSSGTGTIISTNPIGNGLSYLPRSDMTVNGHNVGARIMKQYGKSGTIFGETGYDLLQDGTNGQADVNLWPFPNESLIKNNFASYDPAIDGGGSSGARGFAAGTSIDGSSQTLTKYIWEYLGNQIPCEIYGACGIDVTAPSAPSGLSVL
ncbi:MAG: hypothetical protein WCI36_03615 [bacterium]